MHPGVDRDISVSGIRGIFVVQGNNASKGCKAIMLACVPDYFPGIVAPLYAALCEHRVGHFHEAGDIRSFDVVDIAVRLSAVFDAGFMNVAHDRVELVVHLLGRPKEPFGVLRHFEARSGYAPGHSPPCPAHRGF